jgi:hypothetical protein
MKQQFKVPKSKISLEKELNDIFDENMFNGNSIVLTKESNKEESINLESNITNSNISIHYDSYNTISDLLVLTGDTENIEVNCYAQFPLFFESQNSRYIPNKVKFTIERYCPQSLLKEIHKDKEVAVELCLILISNLSNAFYQSESGWKRLKAELLRDQVSSSKDSTYLKIIELLLKGSKNGAIIERSSNFTIGQESYRYRLTDLYRNKGVTKYEFKTNHAINLVRKNYFKQLSQAIDNPIANNLIKMYSFIDLPSISDIKKQGKKLIKENYITKKGKKLTLLNKHSKSYWKDADDRSFVEDNIELFERLTQNGFLIPMVGDSKSGGRVTDSFTLMPSWIRNMCKINGKEITEADYSALHPNIAMNIYKGNSEYITHEKIAEDLGKDIKEVKIEHLSFFNKTWNQMTKSFLFDYYCKNEPTLMENIYKDKDMFGHKITSKKMFKIEVDIMTSVIKRLNSEGIYVGYVYDALFCSPKDKKIVNEVMNEEVVKLGIKTIAK